MLIIKKLFVMSVVCFCSSVLFGCATTYDRGQGVVLSVKKIQGRDFKPHQGTKTGAAIGGATGAVGGAAAGGAAGLAIGALASSTVPALIAATLGGATVGAVIVGGVGAASGASLGYVMDISKPNAGLYKFVVKPDNNEKPITVTQYSSIIPVDSRVHILEKDDVVFIESK